MTPQGPDYAAADDIPFAEGVELPPPTPQKRPRPDLVPTSSPGDLVPRPSPSRGDEDVHLVPDLVPAPHFDPATPPPSWPVVDVVALDAKPTPPPDVAGLFYAGKNHLVSGEPEALKTWLLLAAASDELKAGRGVLWVDGDDVGAGDLLDRLRSLGVPDEKTARLFAYVFPGGPIAPADVPALTDEAQRRNSRLAVFDGFNPLLWLHGHDPDKGIGVEALYQLLDPIRKAGCACVWTDNVAKSREARGAWAIGSERKKSKAEVHLGLRVLERGGRGRIAKARIGIEKDRPGHLRGSPPGVFVLESDGERCTWRLEADKSKDEEGHFRPTGLMERVSRYLELRLEPQSFGTVEDEVTGKAEYKRKALERLIAEGYVTESEGPRGARLVASAQPYREGDDVQQELGLGGQS